MMGKFGNWLEFHFISRSIGKWIIKMSKLRPLATENEVKKFGSIFVGEDSFSISVYKILTEGAQFQT